MPEQDPQRDRGGEERTSTPLDHPLFLPVLFALCVVWFGYDGYLNDDPDMLEHQSFNRYGFRLLVFLMAHWGYRGYCELKLQRENPWVLPAILAATTLWLGFDGWWSSAPFNVENAPVLRSVFPWLLFATAWYSGAAFRQGEGRRPRFSFSIVLGAPALSFGYEGLVARAGDPEALLWLGGSVALGIIALWSLFSDLRRRGGGKALSP